jgi:metal-dependent hydrolase (beta-lactamase superfamily II)
LLIRMHLVGYCFGIRSERKLCEEVGLHLAYRWFCRLDLDEKVVTTSCGHRGVVNAVKQAMTVSGLQKVHAVLGGFHLAPHNEDYVRQTIKGLVDLDVDHIVPMHCTGEPFYEILKAELPKKVIRSYTGTKLVFGA